MSAIEFTTNESKLFTITEVRNPANNYSLLASNISVDEITGFRYRASLGSLSGVVWIKAVAGATKVVGFADLNNPNAWGYSEVVDQILNLSSTGPGANSLSVAVGNGSSAVAGVIVNVKQGSLVVAWGYTNGAGHVTFNLAAGTYSIAVQSQAGYVPAAPVSTTVPDTTSLTITLTPQTLTPPIAPGLCTVRFIVLNNGSPVQGAVVYAELEDANPMVDSALISRVVHTGATNAQGILDLVMLQRTAFTRGGIYRIRVSDAQGRKLHDRRVTVPSLSTTYAEDLPDA